MKSNRLLFTIALACHAIFVAHLTPGAQEGPKPPTGLAADAGPWGAPVDGIACRLTMKPGYAIGQLISAVVEVKNTSDKTRFLVPWLDPRAIEHLTLEITGPTGKVKQIGFMRATTTALLHAVLVEGSYQPIDPGEVKRFEAVDLRDHFGDLSPGKYTARFRFRSPKAPAKFLAGQKVDKGKVVIVYKDVPAEVTAGQWANKAISAPVAFEMTALAKDDLVVHEWGVFTVFNDVKYANVNRKEEWANLPSFFYRQFPTERLRWVPSAWDKPIVYFYAKKTPLRVKVKVTFAEGAPVVWWPAVASPVDDGGFRTARDPRTPRPFRSLIWDAWIGDEVPPRDNRYGPLVKVEDFALPADCWLQQARLSSASRLTVVGNIEDAPMKRLFPGAKDRSETERFLYYDGLVPAPDYVRCEKIDATSLTLRNHAKFEVAPVFVVDRRAKDTVGFAFVHAKKQPFKAGTNMKIELRPIRVEDWPVVGMKQVRQALLDAGLFEPEADSLLKIWAKRLLHSDGVTAFHILPVSEYDRMLPLDVSPAPFARPVRVGIALHPHVEIEPVLAEQVAALIRQLDSPSFEKRLAADKALLEIGPMAITMLRAELKKGVTVETSRRIQAILERVDAANWLEIPQPAKK
jgi:hypothetical protein